MMEADRETDRQIGRGTQRETTIKCKRLRQTRWKDKNITSLVAPENKFYLKVFMTRQRFVRKFRQEHGYETWQAPLCSQLVRANSCQPQDMLWDVGGLALEHSTLAQMQGGWGEATKTGWNRQTQAG